MSKTPIKRVRRQFDADALAHVCTLPEEDFGTEFDLEEVRVEPSRWSDGDRFYFRDNGSDVLAVAHLDTVVSPYQRTAYFTETDSGLVVHSGALDDRLGAYTILDLLPGLGITYDILLTTGEESGCSTAQHFTPAKDYDWMIEFDRGGTDVVMYEYDDSEVREMVRASGAPVGNGIFSDICYLDHLGIKGFNWGIGYRDYHSTRGYAYLEDTFQMVAYYLRFHDQNLGTAMPHFPSSNRRSRYWYEDVDQDWERFDDVDYDDEPDREDSKTVEEFDDWFAEWQARAAERKSERELTS